MPKNKSKKVVFKPYSMNQMILLPPSLEELIPEKHVVRTVNSTIDRLDLDSFVKSYEGGGASSYDPLMMLKVLIYAYTQRIYTSRGIAKALRENVQFMWISGGNKPDFRTINRFRTGRLKGSIESIFISIVELLIESGHIRLENYFLDGTKIEANSNRYSFVWKKSIEKYSASLQVKIRELLKRIDMENTAENEEYGEKDLDELGEEAKITPEMLEKTVREIDQQLSENPDNRELRKAKKQIEDDYLPRSRKYEEHMEKLGERNSYSKTDEDATFMRMKEDHMRNGQLKPGYNIQIGTENQFIVDYSIHQKPTDTTTLVPHMEKVEEDLGRLPDNVIADAGYGSEENYDYLDSKGINKYVKYNYFHQETKKSFKKNIYHVFNLPYDESSDTYTCPAGRKLVFVKERVHRSENGYLSKEKIYECESCKRCSQRKKCHRGKSNRQIRVRPGLNMHRCEVKKLLTSEKGFTLRSLRGVEVESVFAQIKQNMGFRRFWLRGLEKIITEWGLICCAHDIMKLDAITC